MVLGEFKGLVMSATVWYEIFAFAFFFLPICTFCNSQKETLQNSLFNKQSQKILIRKYLVSQ